MMPRRRPADASNRVTTFELFFDLVYVFAFTQVSGLMADTHSAFGVLAGPHRARTVLVDLGGIRVGSRTKRLPTAE